MVLNSFAPFLRTSYLFVFQSEECLKTSNLKLLCSAQKQVNRGYHI